MKPGIQKLSARPSFYFSWSSEPVQVPDMPELIRWRHSCRRTIATSTKLRSWQILLNMEISF